MSGLEYTQDTIFLESPNGKFSQLSHPVFYFGKLGSVTWWTDLEFHQAKIHRQEQMYKPSIL